MGFRSNGRRGWALGVAALLSSASFLVSSPAARVVTHSATDCRAACEGRNLPASCAWLSSDPRRCLKASLNVCEASEAGGPAACGPPSDLPSCTTHHECPYGALCVDLRCQVVGCGSHNGVADCTGTNRCEGDKCVVAECNAVTANCPRGFHCEPASPPFDSISGTCAPDVPGVGYCTGDADCIEPGNFNPLCRRGICTRQVRRFGRCTTHDDCVRRCRRGRLSARMGRCDAAGLCLCASCADDGQCSQLLACPPGRTARCLPVGTCACRKVTSPTTTTTTTSTIVTTSTIDTSTTTTTVPANDVCCCIFQVSDTQWHCVHASQPSPYLCYVPWPDCCSEQYTVCD